MSVKLSRQLAVLPVEKYRLPKDGRKWQAVARNRMMLADFLGTHGDGDGSRVFPSVATMAKKFGWSESKTYYLLADLKELRLLESTPHYSAPKHHRTRIRQMNIAAFLDHPGLQDRQSQDSKIGQDSKIQDSKIDMQDSKIRVQDSNVTLEPKDTVTDTTTVTTTKSPASPSPIVKRRLQVIEEFSEEVYVALLEFEAMRKKIRKPIPTEHAFELLLKELGRLRREGNDPLEVVNQSIMRSYQGFFPVRNGGNNGRAESFAERNQRKSQETLSRVRRNLDAVDDKVGELLPEPRRNGAGGSDVCGSAPGPHRSAVGKRLF